MGILKRTPDAVQWWEGMLLSPQHFQQQTLRIEHQLSHLMAQLNPFFWGTLSLEVDREKIVGGIFQIDSLKAVMPDGLNVFHDRNEDGDLQIDVRKHLKKKGEELTIFHGVPIRKSKSANPYAEVARYDSIDEVNVEDENSAEIITTIQRLRPKLELMPAENSKFVTIPLAKLTQEKAGYKETLYLRPQLFVGSDSILGREVIDILAEVRKIAELLASSINPGKKVSGEALIQQHQFMVQHLVMELPALEILIQSGSAHPFKIYESLARMIGALASLKQGMVPEPLPSYSHNDFRPCFDKVKGMIEETLLMAQLSYNALPFIKIKEGHFCLPKEEFRGLKTLIISVIGASQSSSKSHIEWISECIIGTKSKIASITKQRAGGAQRVHVKDPGELKIFLGPGESLFKINLTPESCIEGEDLEVINSMGSESLSPHPEAMVFYASQDKEKKFSSDIQG